MNFDNVSKKWIKFYNSNNIYKTNLYTEKKKKYILDMFPYPSGSGLHVGHLLGYTATDVYSRLQKSKGYEVLHPMGFDSFGLPAEQYAIKTNKNPASFTEHNINNFILQLKRMGFSYDFDRMVVTSDPNYFKITQQIFSKFYEFGLAKYKNIQINWCEELKVGLANEEIDIDSNGNTVSQIGGFPVYKKDALQWVLLITKYWKSLYFGLDRVMWPKSIVKLQRDWIGEIIDNDNIKLNLRDWVFSRQRYWGEPIPIIHLEDGTLMLEKKLPLELPKIDNFKPDGKISPLLKAKDWINYDDGKLKGVRDHNTMPQWAGSCWYHIAYLLKKDNSEYLDINSPEAKKIISKWLPVDLYIGGQEHAVSHLLYARFWHHFLVKINYIDNSIPEPYHKLINQGMILADDGQKMSKSRGNVVDPMFLIDKYSSDTLRFYILSLGPVEDRKKWNDINLKPTHKFLIDLFNYLYSDDKENLLNKENEKKVIELIVHMQQSIENLRLNVAISDFYKIFRIIKNYKINKKIFLSIIQLLSFFCPFIGEELYLKFSKQKLDEKYISIYKLDLIKFQLDKKENFNLIIQLNGKLKKVISIKINTKENDIINLAAEKIGIKKYKKYIFIKNKLINIII